MVVEKEDASPVKAPSTLDHGGGHSSEKKQIGD